MKCDCVKQYRGEGICPAVNALLCSIRLKSYFLYNHSVMVGHVARALSEGLGFPKERADLVEAAGFLHDLGKIAIRTDVLMKPGELTRNEWEHMKLHPVLGANALGESQIGSEELIAIVLRHHESEDGSGYPFGVSGEEIPFEAKIINLSDVFSAMITERPYKPSYPKSYCVDEAMRTIRFEAGHLIIIKEILHAVDHGRKGKNETQQDSVHKY